jgi:tetratricopeptide (TPR) repeat protein
MQAGAGLAGAPLPRRRAAIRVLREAPAAVRRAPRAVARRVAALRVTFGVLGAVAVGVAVVRPWLEVPLQTRISATSIRILVGGLPTSRWATYGYAFAVLAGVAVLATLWRRGHASALLGAAGLMVLLLCALMLAQVVLWDAGLRHTLVNQSVQKAVAVQQFGYSVRATQPSAIFLMPLSGVGKIVAGSLDHGFYLCVLGGTAMAVAGWSALLAAFRRHAKLVTAAAAGCMLLVAGAAGPGVVAWYVENSAYAAAQRGDTQAALDGLDTAARLVPAYRQDPDFELARGVAMVQAGDRYSAPALFVLSRNAASAGDRARQLILLDQAVRRSPGDTVVLEEYRARAIEQAVRIHDPSPVLGLPAAIADTALVQYVTGRLLYDAGSFDIALPRFLRTIQLTPDPDVRSSAHTYIGLADLQLGRPDDAKRHLIMAIELDGTGSNGLARSTATGLYRGVVP